MDTQINNQTKDNCFRLAPLDHLIASIAASITTAGRYDIGSDEGEFFISAVEPDEHDLHGTVGLVADAQRDAAEIERALLARIGGAARWAGSQAVLSDIVIVRQLGDQDDSGWLVAGHVLNIAEATARAYATGGGDGSRVIAAYAWSVLGYPRGARIRVLPALGSRLADTVIAIGDHEMEPIAEHFLWYQPVRQYPALTTRESLAELPADSDSIVGELHLRSSAARRHESRRRAAWAAIAQYVLDERWDIDMTPWVHLEVDDCPVSLTDAQAQALATIAALESHGVGGPGGYSGDATARMSWARGLGKGRRQASDGSAWSAAIAALATTPTPADVLAALLDVRHADLEWPMAFALSRALKCAQDRDQAAAWCDVARAVYRRATADDAPYMSAGAVALGIRYGVNMAMAS